MDWLEENGTLEKTFLFPDFLIAMQFMQKATPIIQQLNHHPDWRNIYHRLTVRLSTHDAGNVVTDKDLALAKALDILFEKEFI
jgi:4a-hydroxytetrahydrobiopterin dehydratase